MSQITFPKVSCCNPLESAGQSLPETIQNAAAIKIQSIWRGYSARVKAEKARSPLLSYVLLEKAKHYIDMPSNLENVPLASNGKTPVYLPNDLPVVLKRSGFPQNWSRFLQMHQGHEICETSGYKHLVIPKARVYRGFIVESRLPITRHGTKAQIGLYIEYREQFTSAVKEFTGFLCQSSFRDITGGSCDPYGTLFQPVGRYDNIALYLEEQEGKIGLVDLERFTPECSKEENEWCFFKCRDAIRFFPYHFDEILSTARNFDPNIENYRKKLEIERDEALKFFKLAYEDHLDFIKEKGITLQNPLEIVQISPTRKESIKEVIVSTIRNEHDKGYSEGCLGERPDEMIALFEESFPKILDFTMAFLSKILKREIDDEKRPISTYSQLLACRTLCFRSGDKLYRNLQDEVASELKKMNLDDVDEYQILLSIIKGIFAELANGREIAYYNPDFGYGSRAKQCIFC